MEEGLHEYDEIHEQVERDRRCQFVDSELYDFGRDVVIRFQYDERSRLAGDARIIKLSRYEAQKLFNDLWRYWFRPERADDEKALI